MLQRATGMLGQNLAEQQETLQERLDGINEEIRQGKGNMADDEISLISSSDGDSLTSVDDESTQIDVEIDRYEYQDRAVILPSNLRLALSFQGTGFVESEETAVDDESEADQDMPGIEETEEFDDEGYCSMEDE